jgi:membrane protease YdiL (CAAX protease family)
VIKDPVLGFDQRVLSIIATVAVSLLLIHYLKFSSTLQEFLALADQTLQTDWQRAYRTWEFRQLGGYLWWGWWHLVGYLLLPWLTIRFVLCERLSDYWFGIGELGRHWRGYLLLVTPILFFVFLVSFRNDFVSHYPFYGLARRSWFDLLAWEMIYLFQFFLLEFFFRGFMLRGLEPKFGANAVLIMLLPYMMIHFSKPWLEASGAILFGLFLGLLAMRSRSIWGGVAVHATIAVSMDVAALLHKGGLPVAWWP